MTPPRRALVDWDWGASGIWLILSSEEMAARAPRGHWQGVTARRLDRPRPWVELLSTRLLDDLREWNADGERLYDVKTAVRRDERLVARFWDRARELAERASAELGPTWEVLYRTPAEAWTWAAPQPLRDR